MFPGDGVCIDLKQKPEFSGISIKSTINEDWKKNFELILKDGEIKHENDGIYTIGKYDIIGNSRRDDNVQLKQILEVKNNDSITVGSEVWYVVIEWLSGGDAEYTPQISYSGVDACKDSDTVLFIPKYWQERMKNFIWRKRNS